MRELPESKRRECGGTSVLRSPKGVPAVLARWGEEEEQSGRISGVSRMEHSGVSSDEAQGGLTPPEQVKRKRGPRWSPTKWVQWGKRHGPGFVLLAGIGAIAAGAGLIYLPAGLIAGGVLAVAWWALDALGGRDER